MYKKKNSLKKHIQSILIMICILTISFLAGLLLQNTFNIGEQVTNIFIFSVFLISLLTDGYIYGIITAFIGVILVNFAFTAPYSSFSFTAAENIISAILMISISLMTSTLTIKLKKWQTLKFEGEHEKMRANLLRAVSHDLRTPLTTIYGSASTLLENKNSLTNKQQTNILKGIKEDSEWLIHMVENLLSITRIDSGKIKITKSPTVLEELIDSVIIKFNKRYPEQKITLDIPDEIVVIPMDAILIEQVIINILENAVHHAKKMTKLSLRVFVLNKQAIFEIKDNGSGISEERIPHLFTGYYESDYDNSDSQKRNAGIGLSVCATIIKAHGGDITAENIKTGGAVFRFNLSTEENENDQ